MCKPEGSRFVHFHLLISILTLFASAHAAAQGSTNRGEFFAGAGTSRMGGDEGSRGNGPCVLGGIGRTTFTSDDTQFAWGGGGGVKFFIMGLAAGSVGIGYYW